MKRLTLLTSTFALASFLVLAFAAGPVWAEQSKPALHRADFRLTGASCVVCLRRISKTFRDNKGVLKADVSIYRPYWSIVIYDAHQTNMDNIIKSIAAEKVKVDELEDKPISAVPNLIIPKHIMAPAGPLPTGH